MALGEAWGQVDYGRRAWFAQRGEGEPAEPSLLGAVSAVYCFHPAEPAGAIKDLIVKGVRSQQREIEVDMGLMMSGF